MADLLLAALPLEKAQRIATCYAVGVALILLVAVFVPWPKRPGRATRGLLGMGLLWVFLGPVWSHAVKRHYGIKQDLFKWSRAENQRRAAAAERILQPSQQQLLHYAREFLSDEAYAAYTSGGSVSLGNKPGEPVSVWERFEKGLPELNASGGRWDTARVFAVAFHTLQAMDTYKTYGRSDLIGQDHTAGVRRCLDADQVVALHGFLQLCDPENRTGYSSAVDGALACANNAPPFVIAQRTYPVRKAP